MAPNQEEQVWRPSRRARQLALAIWIDRQIEAGRLRNDAHAARMLGITRARISQILNLALASGAEKKALLAQVKLSH